MSFHIVMTFPISLGVPGGGTNGCIQIARHLAKCGAQVTLLPIQTNRYYGLGRSDLSVDSSGANIEMELETDSVKVEPIQRISFHYLMNSFWVRQAVLAAARKEPVDAVIGWHHELVFLMGALRLRKIPVGLITAGPDYSNFRGKFPGKYLRKTAVQRSVGSANIIFAPSQFTRNNLLKMFPEKSAAIKVTHWGVSKSFFSAQSNPARDVFRIVFYGWFVPEKGVFDLIKALGLVDQSTPQKWEFILAGWGNDADVYQAAEQSGIIEKVKIVGRLDELALVRLLETARLAVLPSYVESFGLAVIEAQAAGLPVLAYQAGAIPEIVQDGSTGWLVPIGDVAGLARSIRTAMENPGRTAEMGLAGRQRVREMFSWERTAGQILGELTKIRDGIV